MKSQLQRNIRQAGLKHYRRAWLFTEKLFLICALPLTVTAQFERNETGRDSIVRVAYGSQTQDQVTSAISSVSGADLRKTHTASLSNALVGMLPGVTVMQNGGAPGFDDPSFMIRGMHTFLNNGMLILIDGIQINSLSNISPDEIESVTVLKDAAALALYGAKGANGVLLVTTKRGQLSDKINISFKARYGLQEPVRLPKFAGSYDYARLYNEALVNDGRAPLYSEKDLDGYRSGSDPYLYPDVNWYDEVLRENSYIQDYSLTFDGGNETAKYFVMAGFMDSQGLYDHTDQEHNANIGFKSINFRANVDLNITKNLSARIGIGGNIQDRKFPPISTEDMWKNMATYAPNLYSVRTPDGKITGTANFPNNPVGYLLEKGYQSRHDRNIQTNVQLTQKLDFLTEGLSVFGGAMFDNLFQNRYDKTRNYAYFEPVRTISSIGQDSVYYLQRGLDTDLSVSTGSDYENNRLIFRVGFDYNRKLGQHEVGGMIMFQQDKYTVLGNASPFAQDNLAGRLTYNYRQKYFAEAAFSYSGLENYAPGHRFGFFPALSGGWLIHKEGFWKENKTVNYLKLRASAGLVGNDKGASRFSYHEYWGTASNQGYYFGTGQNWSPGLVQNTIANPDVTWEKSFIANFGVDTRLLNNKLSLNADVFYEYRNDILVNMNNIIPSASGYSSSVMKNKGEVSNRGVELELLYNDRTGNLDYYFGGQFSFTRNQIEKSYETPKQEAYSMREGHPVNQYFGLEAVGFFKDESDIAFSPVQSFSPVRPGDLKYKDQNGDDRIDMNDEVAIGFHSYPDINYTISAGVSYKGFDLGFLLYGTANRSVYLDGYMFWPFVDNANISSWAVDGHWTSDTHAGATFPRLTAEPNDNNYRSSSFWVRDINSWRLRNAELGYTFGNSSSPKSLIKSLRVYVSGTNLFTWDDLDVDVDPETLSRGYPVMKTYTVGLNMNF
ncbi:MAG: SusC/RagA family TonB-linked outer membrane protein [Mangrovibacterium sp.]